MSDFEARTRRLAIVAGLADSVRPGWAVRGPGLAPSPRPTSASESALPRSRLTLLEDAVLPALGLDRLDAHGLAGPRRRELRLRRCARDPFTGGPPSTRASTSRPPAASRCSPRPTASCCAAGGPANTARRSRSCTATATTPLYGHLEETLVEQGQQVRRGDRVGLVGSTGRSTAPHLHYEVHVDGRPVNPLEYILESR